MKKKLIALTFILFLSCFSIGIGLLFDFNIQNADNITSAYDQYLKLTTEIYYYQASSGGSTKQGKYTSPTDGSQTEAGTVKVQISIKSMSSDPPDTYTRATTGTSVNASTSSFLTEAMVGQTANLVDHWVEYEMKVIATANSGFSASVTNSTHTATLHTYKENSTTSKRAQVYFRPKAYSDTYNTNGGTFSSNATTKNSSTDFYSAYNLPEEPKRQGYVFDGWWTAATGGSRLPVKKSTASGQIFYAHWVPAVLTIDANGGNYPVNSVSSTAGLNVKLGIPTREGYKFQGWVMDSGVDSGSLSTLGTPIAETDDKFFRNGNNGLVTWGTNITQSRVQSPDDLDFNRSDYINRFEISAPNTRAGFVTNNGKGTPPTPNTTFYTVVHAKLSQGAQIVADMNGGADSVNLWCLSNGYHNWRTSDKSDGIWETYVARYVVKSGQTNYPGLNYWLTVSSELSNITIDVAYCAVYNGTAVTDAGFNNGKIDQTETTFTFGTKNATIRALWVEDYWTYYSKQPSGDGTEFNPYKIKNGEELAWLDSKSDKNKWYVSIENDIDLIEHKWLTISTLNNTGYYDLKGNNHNIKNMFIEYKGGRISEFGIGLFGLIDTNSYIKDLSVYGKINISSIGVSGASVGGIAGSAWSASLTNVNSYIDFNVANNVICTVGGIVGQSHSSIFTNCNNYRNIINNQNDNDELLGTGGIVGRDWSPPSTTKIKLCYNYGIIEGLDNIAGIIGESNGATIENSSNYGSIKGRNRVGGIVGGFKATTIKHCYNFADIIATGDIGGIVGRIDNETNGKIENCLNEGDISCEGVTGGLIGSQSSKNIILKNSYAYCKILITRTDRCAGGLVGYSNTLEGNEYSNCFFISSGTCSSYVDPFYGTKYGNYSSIFNSCYSVINNNKNYTKGDFETFQIAGNLNDGYPVMNGLFNVFEANGSAVLKFFTDNGFIKLG